MQSRFSSLALAVAVLGAVCARATDTHYVTDRSTAAVLPVTGGVAGKSVLTGLAQAWSIAYDPYLRQVYASNIANGRIVRQTSTGGQTTIVDVPGAVFRGLVVDSRGDRLYYLDSDANTLNVCGLDGVSRKVLFSGLRRPNDMVLDAVNRRLYVTDSGLDGVLRYDLGTGKSAWILTGAAVDGVWGVAVWPQHNWLFLSDHVHNAILRADLNGSNLTTIVTGMETPRGLTVDPHNACLYWLEADGGRLYRANPDGNAVTTVTAMPFPGCRDLVSFESEDEDGDFMNDSWERDFFGTILREPAADSDRDGQSNGTEFWFGSDPSAIGDTARITLAAEPSHSGRRLRIAYREREETWFKYVLRHSWNLTTWEGAQGIVDSRIEILDGFNTRVLEVDTSLHDPTQPHYFRIDAEPR